MNGLFKDTKKAFSIALELKNKGWKYGDVADQLNAKGFKSATGVPWDKHTVSRLMVAHNVRRKRPRATKVVEPVLPDQAPTHHGMLRAIKHILSIDNMAINSRVAIVNQILDGVQ